MFCMITGKYESTKVEMCLIDVEGNASEATYTAPMIMDSALPPLLGNKTLRKTKATIDCGDGKMVLPGPGGVEVKLSHGSRVFALEIQDTMCCQYGQDPRRMTRRLMMKEGLILQWIVEFASLRPHGLVRRRSLPELSSPRAVLMWELVTPMNVSHNSSQTDGQTIESLMKPNVRRADRLAWIMSHKRGLRQQLLQDPQFRTVHFHHDLHSRAQAQRMLNEFCLQSPDLLWVRLAGPCAGSGNKMDALRSEHLCHIINQQSHDGRLVVVEANERSQVWNLQAVRECMAGFQLILYIRCATMKL